MKRGRKPKEVPVDEVRAWRAKRWTLGELAQAFGVSPSCLKSRLRESGGDPLAGQPLRERKAGRPPRGPGQKRRERAVILRAWRAKGWTLAALGYAFGMSREGIRQSLLGGDPAPTPVRRAQPGEVFGRLTVLAEAGFAADGRRRVLCRCECGNEKVITGSSLTSPSRRTRSCGCLRSQAVIARCGRMVTIDGRTQHLSAWLRELGKDHRTVALRVRAGWSFEDALTAPPQCGYRLDGKEKRKRGAA